LEEAMKKKLIIAIIVFTAIGASLFYFLTTGNIGVKYDTAEVKMGELEQYVEEDGRVSSRNIRRYYGNGSTKVEEMPLELGGAVKKGQLLVKYEDDLGLEIQKVEKQIEALKATYSDALSGTDMERVNSAKIEISRIGSNLELAKKNKDRIEELYKSGAVSLIELEQAINSMEQLESSLAMAQNTYDQLIKGVSADTRKRYEAEIDVMLLTLEIYKKNQEEYVERADIDGIVTELNTFEGDIPSPGSMILEIQNSSEKVVLVDFLVEDARKIRSGMMVELKDQNLGISMVNLKVSKIYPKAFVALSELGVEENRQTVEISLPVTSDELAYGLEVETKVMIEEQRDALLIPAGAVYQNESKKFVRVLEDGEVVEREVIAGIEFDNNIVVKEGLREGELVILNYQEK
jgi:HlyD family secretion protein